MKPAERAVAGIAYDNVGPTPARDVVADTGIAIEHSPPTDKCPNITTASTQTMPDALPSHASIGIKARRLAYGSCVGVLTDDDIEAIKGKRKSLYLHSRVQYGRDGKTAPYFTEYYGRYNPEYGKFDICPTHNDPN